MTRYAIALGSNQGDRVGHLRAAIGEISRLGQIEGVSGLYETAPIGGPEQDPFLNAVVVARSTLPPSDLLDRLQDAEAGRHRERAERWGPRTLDLDIVAMEPGSISSERLTIPHPRAAERRFVLDPLCDVWPDAMVADGVTAAHARRDVAGQESERLLADWTDAGRRLGPVWVLGQLLLFLAIGVALVADGSLPGFVGPGPGDPVDAWRVVGAVLLVTGAVGVVVAARSLGRALTAMPEPVPDASLIESGLYHLVRHPIYGAGFLAMLGASLLFASPTATVLSLLLLFFFWAKSGYEERQLRIAYPGYSAYRRRVRHRLLPFVF
jgi:2-amino-4-hydroxy-6-hydroxymethyldihydropteridine diphosphokinase